MKTEDYQKHCFAEYKKSIGYPEKYTYLHGNPIRVLVPVETALNKVMIVGAYPSAKFFTVEGIADTPLSDNDSPFSNETYFDGSQVRTIASGRELNEVILKNIDVERTDCWITDLQYHRQCRFLNEKFGANLQICPTLANILRPGEGIPFQAGTH